MVLDGSSAISSCRWPAFPSGYDTAVTPRQAPRAPVDFGPVFSGRGGWSPSSPVELSTRPHDPGAACPGAKRHLQLPRSMRSAPGFDLKGVGSRFEKNGASGGRPFPSGAETHWSLPNMAIPICDEAA